MMLAGHESLVADIEAIEDSDEQNDRAMHICDAVGEELGWPHLIECFIDTDYEMNTRDEDAVTEQMAETSGYNAARERLFPA